MKFQMTSPEPPASSHKLKPVFNKYPLFNNPIIRMFDSSHNLSKGEYTTEQSPTEEYSKQIGIYDSLNNL